MKTGRNNIIDAYRGIAILGVLIFHYTVRWPELYGYTNRYSELFHLGALGVQLFFVVSGLVITMTVIKSANPIEFVARRLARLYPALVFAACITFVTMQWGPEPFRVSLLDLLASLTMDAKALGRNYVDGAYWTLAVEIRFYLIVALSRWLLKDLFWVGVIAFALLNVSTDAELFGRMTTYWPYFLLGMAGWYAIFERRIIPAVALGGSSFVLYLSHNLGSMMVDLCIGGATFSLLALLWLAPGWNPYGIRMLAWTGRISYSLYVLHQNMGVALIQQLTRIGVPDVAAMAITICAAMVLAWLSFTYVEQPGGRMMMRAYWAARDRWVSTRTLADPPS